MSLTSPITHSHLTPHTLSTSTSLTHPTYPTLIPHPPRHTLSTSTSHTHPTPHTHPTSTPSLTYPTHPTLSTSTSHTHPTHPTLSTSTSHTHHSLICICRSARPVSISESLNGSGIPLRGRDCSDRLPPFPCTAACRYLPERERERLRVDKF